MQLAGASGTGARRLDAPKRGDTAHATAAMVSTQPITRMPVTAFLPPGPMPSLSTSSPLSVCPVTVATVNSATPSRPDVNDWANTKKAPMPPART